MEEFTPEAIELTDEQITAALVKAGGHPSPIIDEVLASLRPRVERMIRQRFGIGTDSLPMTLEEIGRQEGLSRERIRQLQHQAFNRLRHPSLRGKLLQLIKENDLTE